MKFKVGDLVIRNDDGMLGIVVNIDRQERGIIRLQYYAVPEKFGYTGWYCDDVARLWSHQ